MPRPVVRPMRALMAYMATMQLDTVRRHDVGHARMVCACGRSVPWALNFSEFNTTSTQTTGSR
jgi:hypothetical protein